jgi:hypothetical protein
MRRAAFAFVLASMLAPIRAHAQGSDAAAQLLFDDGKRLLSEGKYHEACPKFEESHRLAPNGGTLTNLAECLELDRRFASAWLRYKELAARANAAHQAPAEKRALDKAAALEPKLARLTIATSAVANVDRLEILRDGAKVDRPEWDLAVPIDSGEHRIEARAPGYAGWSQTVTVTEAGPLSVSIPPLARENTDAQAAPPPEIAKPIVEPAPTTSTQRTIGLIVAGTGVVAAGVGIVFGLVASSKNDDALRPENCPEAMRCRASGLALTEEAKDAATVSTVSFVAAGILLAGGAFLFFTAPRAQPSQALRVVPRIGARTGGIAFEGAFQ